MGPFTTLLSPRPSPSLSASAGQLLIVSRVRVKSGNREEAAAAAACAQIRKKYSCVSLQPEKIKVPVQAHSGAEDSYKGFADPATVKPW